jgi:hypothetical protein
MSKGRIYTPEEIERAKEFNARFQQFLQSEQYRTAQRQENESREIPFLGLPEYICGIQVRPLTVVDLSIHCNSDCPFLARSFLDGSRKPIAFLPDDFTEEFAASSIIISPGWVARFLWIQSVAFRPVTGSWLRRLSARTRWRLFMSRCRGLEYGESCEQIRRFLDDALSDIPSGSSAKRGAQVASWIAAKVDFIASRYHWPEREILNMPLRRLSQYERRIVETNSTKRAALTSKTELLKIQWLKANRPDTERN